MIWFALAAFGAALALSAALVPVARRLALAAGLVAPVRPDRLHTEPKPLGGGLAIADTLLVVIAGAWIAGLAAGDALPEGLVPPAVEEHLRARTPTLLRLGIGFLLFFVVGLLDDRYDLPAAGKLVLQCAAAAVVVWGLEIRASVWIDEPTVAGFVTFLWFVAVVNAYNMLDHMDGLAAAVGMVALLALAVGQMLVNEWFVPGVALAGAGALAGFLIYNFPPARLFMGDAGSHSVGYLMAALAVAARYYHPYHETPRLVVLVPLAVLAVPLVDAACVTLSRIARGASPFAGDAASHLGHRMIARGISSGTAVFVASGAAALAGAASVAMYWLEGPYLAGAWALVGVALAIVLAMRRGAPQRGAT
jgi:UDP-GlcNAc:undecaprenyl-phosphate GlcNAc-1-phosphate transferase